MTANLNSNAAKLKKENTVDPCPMAKRVLLLNALLDEEDEEEAFVSVVKCSYGALGLFRSKHSPEC